MAMTTATSGIYIGQNRPLASRLANGGAAVRAGVGQVHCSVRVSVVGIDMIDVSIVVNVYVLMMRSVGSLVSVVGTSSVLVEVLIEVLVEVFVEVFVEVLVEVLVEIFVTVALAFVTVSVTFILSLERLDTRLTH